MGLHDDSEETRRIGVWDLPHERWVIELTPEQYACLERNRVAQELIRELLLKEL